MGIGDELIAAGQAKRHGGRVRILGAKGEPRWHPVWAGNPHIAHPDEPGPFPIIVNGSGARPYIAGKTSQQWTWREFECEPAEIVLTDLEQAYGRLHSPDVVIEPWIKPQASPNKQWPFWKDFVRLALARGHRLTQLGPVGTNVIRGVEWIRTDDFRLACAVLGRARLFVGQDGGLMHAAAALGVPAVVIRGAYVSERVTGYASHRNLFTGEGLGCGMRVPCSCCRRAMAAIPPERVLSEMEAATC